MHDYDFSGWATKNDMKCSDGRTIRRNAFKDNDGAVVPLVWNHQHDSVDNVLGLAVLENRDNGVYAYCSFNDTARGQNAKKMVAHGDISALSIFANHLQEVNGNVTHGEIKEVSLVLHGANPGAYIDSIMSHSADGEEDIVATIYTGEKLYIKHSDMDEEDETMADIQDVLDTLDDEQLDAVYTLVGYAAEQGQQEGYDAGVEEGYDAGAEDAYADVEDSMVDDEDDYYEDDDEEYYEEEDDDDMKHNLFDGGDDAYYAGGDEGAVLSHAETEAIFNDAKQYGSLRESVLAHTDGNDVEQYGIQDINWLFPEARNLNVPPDFIKREMAWVTTVMSGVHHTPFSRIKSMFADIREDEARAKGYFKGNRKKYEVFSLLKRTTDPQTIYKKQKLDRDDVVDITDFDVVAWLKSEMRMMLDEELARAILIGDDRLADSEDKISPDHIRPIWTDDQLYTIRKTVTTPVGGQRGKELIKTVLYAYKEYRGTGSPTLFTTEDMLTEMLLLEDGIGHFLYPNKSVLATTLRVKDIVTVPVMSEITHYRNASNVNYKPLGIIVNLSDYNVGADKGGAVNMFDDFDIDFNQMKYLIETRCSGALIKPFSAIVLEEVVANPTNPS